MTISLSFFGAADEVTGSRHLLTCNNQRILLDCGLFQGHRREAIEKNKSFPFDAKKISTVLLSHAHIDHSGGLPMLTKAGFNNPIHSTLPTADLCRFMLIDSAHLQEEDAKFFNKIHAADGETIEPLYTQADAEAANALFNPHGYNDMFSLGAGVGARFLNAGHVLGSAMVQLELDTPKGKKRVLFTGDLGRRKALLMNPPEIPNPTDILIIESTYGDRTHPPLTNIEETFATLIKRAIAEHGKILIPSFALERTQEIAFILERLRKTNRIPPIHIYVDSPMAVNITEIFQKHLDCYCLAPDFQRYAEKVGDPFGFETIRYVRTVEESKSLNNVKGPHIIISASGMCEGGRILHHLRNNIGLDNTTVLLVGYQAQGTLGRRLQEGAKKVRIFGLQHDVRARIETMHNFSAHADQDDLIWFIKGMDPRPQQIFLVHGDDEDRKAFAGKLKSLGIDRVQTPMFGQQFPLFQ